MHRRRQKDHSSPHYSAEPVHNLATTRLGVVNNSKRCQKLIGSFACGPVRSGASRSTNAQERPPAGSELPSQSIAWSYVPSEENNKVFGRAQSFVPGAATNVQFMVKDSKKYAATGGWGFAQFKDGKPADAALLKTCFPCHEPVKARDFVFTHYAP
jgi:hypothetical protein